MSFVTTFVKILVVLTIGAFAVLVVALLAREIALVAARQSLEQRLQYIKTVALNPREHRYNCPNTLPTQTIEAAQLRFVNDTDYFVELVCRGQEFEPVRISEHSLPYMAKKKTGSSGIYAPVSDELAPGKFSIEVYGRTADVVFGKKIPDADRTLASQPKTTCEGFGFTCCDSLTETMKGVSAGDRSTDCPSACAEQCVKLPTVLSFSAVGDFVTTTRVLTITKNTPTVEFGFRVQEGGVPLEVIVLDLGDGTVQSIAPTEKSFMHTYACRTGSCTFDARIFVRAEDGSVSPQTHASSMKVLMK